MAEVKHDVLICGGGPVGLVMAYYLSRAGLSVYIAEQREVNEQLYGRAITLYQRTLEMLDQVDLFEDLSQIGTVGRNSINFDRNGNRAPGRGFQAMFTKAEPTSFDFSLSLRQKYTEDVLRKNLALHGGELGMPWTVKSFTTSESGSHPVKATLEHTQSKETKNVSCQYIIGCDGGNSTIRNLAKIPFEGGFTARRWVRVDGVVKSNIPRSTFCTLESSTHGHILYVNLDHGVSRVCYALSDELESKYGTDLTKEEAIFEAKRAMAPFEIEFLQVDWWTTYRIGQRLAKFFFQDKRVLLAGDAAHTHSSALAQGLNGGIHDAINLSWKLAGVLKGFYDPSILDTYEPERKPIADKVISMDKEMSRLVSGDLTPEMLAGKTVNELMLELVNANIAFVVGLGIGYGPSLLHSSTVSAGTISPGQRGPDALLRRVGLRIPLRLHEVLKNNVKLHFILFAGPLHKTISQIQAIRKIMESSPLNKELRPALNFLTILPGQEVSVYRSLEGSNPFGRVMWDPDRSAHTAYGTEEDGGIVVLRPDGYVGACEELGEVGFKNIEKYLGAFVLKSLA